MYEKVKNIPHPQLEANLKWLQSLRDAEAERLNNLKDPVCKYVVYYNHRKFATIFREQKEFWSLNEARTFTAQVNEPKSVLVDGPKEFTGATCHLVPVERPEGMKELKSWNPRMGRGII